MPTTPLRVTGIWYDGQSTEGAPVELVWAGGDHIALVGLAQAETRSVADMRIAPRLGNTPRGVSFGGPGRCQSMDHQGLRALEVALGRGEGSRWMYLLESRWLFAVLAALFLVVGGAAAMKWGLPWAAQRVAMATPDAVAYEVGRGALRLLDGTLLKETELSQARQAELHSKFETMAAQHPELPLTLHFRRGLGPNAFALPDGTVLLTDELEGLATDDQQLLSVLAHEIGHVHHRHGLRMALESATVALLLSVYLGDIADVGVVAAGMPTAVVQAHYSRDHETQADDFAFDYMARAGIDHHHFADIMTKLQESVGGEQDGVTQYIASHPPTDARIRRFQGTPSGGPD